MQNGSEAAFVPTGAFFCFDAAGVQVVQYIREGFIVRDPAIDLPDDFSFGLVHDDAAVHAAFQAKGQAAVALALAGIIHQAPGDVLGHVLAVELVDVHHAPECKAPGGGIIKIFLGVEDTDAQLVQPGFVHQGLQHIPADPV